MKDVERTLRKAYRVDADAAALIRANEMTGKYDHPSWISRRIASVIDRYTDWKCPK
jgi:hypothetical protein